MEQVLGFTIRGIAAFGTDKQAMFITPTSPDVVKMLEHAAEEQFGNEFKAVECVLPRSGSLGVSISPFEIREAYSAYTFNMPATDEVGKYFFRKADRAVTRLEQDLSNVSTTLTSSLTDLHQPRDFMMDNYPAGAIYIEDETILLRRQSSSYHLLRGVAGTEARSYPAGTNVFKQIPRWLGKETIIFSYDPSRNHLQIREVTQFSDAVSMQDATVRVKLRSIFAGLDNRLVDTNPAYIENPNITQPQTFEVTTQSTTFGREFKSISPQDVPINFIRSSVYKDIEEASGTLRVFFRIDDMLTEWLLQRNKGEWSYWHKYSTPYGEIDRTSILGSTPLSEYDEGDELGVAKEVLFVEKQFNHSPFNFKGLPQSILDKYGEQDESFVETIYRYHPLAIVCSLLFSTNSQDRDPYRFDILHPNWSLDLSSSLTEKSLENIHQLIYDTQDMAIEYLVLGWEPGGVKIIEKCRNLLYTYGFRFSQHFTGELKFDYLSGAPNVIDFSKAASNRIHAIPSSVSFDNANEGKFSVVSGTYGNLPWKKGSPFSINVDVEDEEQFSNHGTSTSVSVDTISDINLLEDLMITRAIIQGRRIPRLKIRVQDAWVHSNNYDLGAYITLAELPLRNAYLFDEDGNRVGVDPMSTRWLGQIIGRRFLTVQKEYELDIIFPNVKLARWRSPSLIVSDVESYPSGHILLKGVDAFGTVDKSWRYFKVEDRIQFWTQDGRRYPSNVESKGTVEIISPEGIIVSTDWAVTVLQSLVGLVVELAHIDTNEGGNGGFYYPNRIENVDRAYVYLSNVQGVLGNSKEEGDSYG